MKYKGTKIVKLCLLRLFLCSKWEFFERLAAIGIFDLSGFHLVKRKSGNSSRVTMRSNQLSYLAIAFRFKASANINQKVERTKSFSEKYVLKMHVESYGIDFDG